MTRTVEATALREGQTIAEADVMFERIEHFVKVPIAGSMRNDIVDRSRRGPTTVRFHTVDDAAFFEELQFLARLGMDHELQREHRGWAPAPMTLDLGEGRIFEGCILRPALNSFGPATDLHFTVEHETL